MKINIILFFTVLVFISCQSESVQESFHHTSKGKLFIIGGGKRGDSLMKRMIDEAQLQDHDYAIIFPMASEEPDSSAYFAKQSLVEHGLDPLKVISLNIVKDEMVSKSKLDSILNAKLIYIPGGDQNRFMSLIANTGVVENIKMAFKEGAMIAGTSAGAAVMSEKMITGNELKYADYESTFRNIEKENIEIKEGLGLITNAIIDQHFVKRSRHNRLLSSVLEHPNLISIGIDESTAILVKDGVAEVVGGSQVLVFGFSGEGVKTHNSKLGAKGIIVDIYLPGQTFKL